MACLGLEVSPTAEGGENKGDPTPPSALLSQAGALGCRPLFMLCFPICCVPGERETFTGVPRNPCFEPYSRGLQVYWSYSKGFLRLFFPSLLENLIRFCLFSRFFSECESYKPY